MKIYLSGKISGLEDLNKPKFEHYQVLLEAKGHEVINPHMVDPGAAKPEWLDYMKADLKEMLDCEMVAVLDDWYDSRGAMIEVNLAADLGIPVVHAAPLALNNRYDHVGIEREITIKRTVTNY